MKKITRNVVAPEESNIRRRVKVKEEREMKLFGWGIAGETAAYRSLQ